MPKRDNTEDFIFAKTNHVRLISFVAAAKYDNLGIICGGQRREIAPCFD